MKPTFSLIHPSARPDQWEGIYSDWVLNADDTEQVEYILSTNTRWGFKKPSANASNPGLRLPSGVSFKEVENHGGYVEAVNTAAAISTGFILIVIADDQHPCPHWDTEILNFISKQDFDRGEYVIQVRTNTPTETERGITVMPIISRNRYSKLGYIFYPGYESMYADNDLTSHAKQDGCFIVAGDDLPIFPHIHPINTPGLEMDDAYKAQNRHEAYVSGDRIFRARVLNKFTDVTQEQLSSITPANTRKTIAVCLPGEIFSSTWVSAWTELFVNLFSRYNVVPIFCHTSNVYVTRGVLAAQTMQQLTSEVKPDYVLWIDDDNPVKWEHVIQLITDLEHVPEADMVVGWCWIWDAMNDKFIASCGYLKEEDNSCLSFTGEVFHDSVYDLIHVKYSGFPLVLMRMDTLRKVSEKHKHPFSPIIEPRHPWGAISEDVAFCKRVSDMGMKIFVDRRVRVDHLKTVAYGPEVRYGLPSTGSDSVLPAAENSNPVLVEKK